MLKSSQTGYLHRHISVDQCHIICCSDAGGGRSVAFQYTPYYIYGTSQAGLKILNKKDGCCTQMIFKG
ncbi:MAG: hypothetical protein WBJ84_11300 [Bacteroidales bacterium]